MTDIQKAAVGKPWIDVFDDALAQVRATGVQLGAVLDVQSYPEGKVITYEYQNFDDIEVLKKLDPMFMGAAIWGPAWNSGAEPRED